MLTELAASGSDTCDTTVNIGRGVTCATHQHILPTVCVSTETLSLPPQIVQTDTPIVSTRIELLGVPWGHRHLIAGALVAEEGVVPVQVRSVDIGQMDSTIPRAGHDLPVATARQEVRREYVGVMSRGDRLVQNPPTQA